jgi:hypothetical protein
MNSSWPKAALDNLKSTSWVKDYIFRRNANVVEDYVAVAVGSVIEAYYREHAVNGNTWGIAWNQDNRLLLILGWICGI